MSTYAHVQLMGSQHWTDVRLTAKHWHLGTNCPKQPVGLCHKTITMATREQYGPKERGSLAWGVGGNNSHVHILG